MPPKVTVGPAPGGASTVRVQGGRPWNVTEQEYTRQELDHLKKKFEELKAEPLLVGTIVEIREGRMSLSFGPGNAVDVHAIEDAKVGHRVLVTRNTMQAVEVIADEVPTGSIITVARVAEHGMIEAEVGGLVKTFRSSIEVAKGERVIVDPSMTFVIGSLGMPPSDFSFAPKIRVSWDDVGGHAEAKEHLREAIELPYSHPDLFAAYGKRTVRGVLLHGPSGTGKCLGPGTPVLMHDGTIKKVEEIAVGDRLMGPDSSARTVLDLGRGRSPMYRVTPVKGEAWTCNDAHILTLVGSGDRVGQTIDIAVGDYLAMSKWERSCWKLWRTDVEFPTAELFVDPYLAGIWLGDGGVHHFEITTMDQEVIDYCTAIAPAYGLVCRISDTPSKAKKVALVQDNHRVKGVQGVSPNRLRDALRAFVNDDGEKRIPLAYLSANREQRSSLLAGILDSDGHLTCGGYDLITKSPGLRDGVLFLARSLGFAAYSAECQKSIKAIGFTGTYQRISISGDIDRLPLRVAHKKATGPRKQLKRVNVTGFELEPIGEGDYYGFVLDGDHRFLLGDFTVTHNTLLAKAAATAIAKAHGKTSSSGFIYVKGPELLSKWVGKSEESVRGLFIAAREHKVNHGYPAVVFLDECDALLGTRDAAATASLNATIVPQFLSEMDGLDDHAAMFILATNRPDLLDAAVTREGRIDRKVKVGRPSRDDAKTIFAIHLRDRPVFDEDYAERAVSELYSDDRVIRRVDDNVSLRLRDFVNGAMIAEMVERASTSAMLRDIEAGRKKARGITAEDLVDAINHAERANRDTNHGMAIRDLLDEASSR